MRIEYAKNMKKFTMLVVVISFVLHDIGWAFMDNDTNVRATLAPEPFSNVENSAVRAHLLYMITLIERSQSYHIAPEVMTIDAVQRILKTEGERPRNGDIFPFVHEDGCAKIDLSEGYHLCYYDPVKFDASHFVQSGYGQVGGITGLNRHLSRVLVKDLKYIPKKGIQAPNQEISAFVNLLENPSEEIKSTARQALLRIGEDPERWGQALASLRQWEEDNSAGRKRVAEWNLVNSPDDYWFRASVENLDFIRLIINDPLACSIDRVEGLLKIRFYTTGRTAYVLSGTVTEKKVTLYLPEGPLRQLERDSWRCDYNTFPDGPEHFFTVKTALQSAAEKEPVGDEVATIAYSIEGNALYINQFLVNDPYIDHGVATWLFKWLVSDILAANDIEKIRFDYHCVRSQDFLLGIAGVSGEKRVVIGPYLDEYGEYYLPGEFFKDSAVDERINPAKLIGISKGLIASIDPGLPVDEALMKVADAIDAISEASGCARLVLYLPDRNEKIAAAENKSTERIIWASRYQRNIRPSKVNNEPLRGEKRLLEMMVMNDIEPITIPGICEFRDGTWLISDRLKLVEHLRNDDRFKKEAAEAEELIKDDLKKSSTGYGPAEGNSILYAYAVDHYRRPLFLFAVIGRLTDAQKGAVITGFYQSRAAAQKIYELEALRVRAKDVERVEAVFMRARAIDDRFAALFHALGTATSVSIRRMAKADPEGARKALEADQVITEVRAKCDKMVKYLSLFTEQIRGLSKSEPPEDFGSTVVIQGLGRAAQSTINIYHLLVMADTIDKARSLYATRLGGGEDIIKDSADSLTTVTRYLFERQRLTTLNDLLSDNEYKQAVSNYESIAGDIKEIPVRLREIKQSLLEWEEKSRDIFEMVRLAPGSLDNVKPFFDWIDGLRNSSGNKLSREENAGIMAAFYINGLLPVLEDIIPFADLLISREVKKRPVDLVAIIEESIFLGVKQAQMDGLGTLPVTYIHKDPAIRVLTDPEMLKVFLAADLIKNAFKYSRPDGGGITVTVDKSDDGKYARISVHDTGVGISETDRRENLFKRERRLKATKDTVPGTGLGLYFARRMALRLGAQIVLEESVVGQGSTFTIYLPMEGHETVWPLSQDYVDRSRDKIQLLSHVATDLKAALLKERDLIVRTAEMNPSQEQFLYWEEFNELISGLEKAAAIQGRLKEDLDANDLSAAYLEDALGRRISPLIDPLRIKRVTEHIKAYRDAAQLQAGAADTLDEILTGRDGSPSGYIFMIEQLLAKDNASGGGQSNSDSRAVEQRTAADDQMLAYLESLHRERMIAAESAQPIILISEELFDDVDVAHLKGLLVPETGISICDLDTIARLSTNNAYSKEKLVSILNRDAYGERWKPHSAQRNNNRATLLVLENGAFKGSGYLHLEGVTGFALAMAAKRDRSSTDRIMRYIKTLFEPPEKRDGGVISETELEECLNKDAIEFFDQIRLNLKPIEPFNTEGLLERYKLIVENYLVAA